MNFLCLHLKHTKTSEIGVKGVWVRQLLRYLLISLLYVQYELSLTSPHVHLYILNILFANKQAIHLKPLRLKI